MATPTVLRFHDGLNECAWVLRVDYDRLSAERDRLAADNAGLRAWCTEFQRLADGLSDRVGGERDDLAAELAACRERLERITAERPVSEEMYDAACSERDALAAEAERLRCPVCIGTEIISKLADAGYWTAPDGRQLIAADTVFKHNPFAAPKKLAVSRKWSRRWKELARFMMQAYEHRNAQVLDYMQEIITQQKTIDRLTEIRKKRLAEWNTYWEEERAVFLRKEEWTESELTKMADECNMLHAGFDALAAELAAIKAELPELLERLLGSRGCAVDAWPESEDAVTNAAARAWAKRLRGEG